jgi:predicted P-loop ATPase
MHNARLAIIALGIECSYDTFHNKMLFGYRVDAAPPDMMSVMLGEVTDNGIIRLRQIMSDHFGFDMKDPATRDAVVSLALEHCFDPVRDMLDLAEGAWDGVERLERMAVTHFNCADTPLNRAIVRKTMIAAVRRVRRPGCKFDNITVMESQSDDARPAYGHFLKKQKRHSIEVATTNSDEYLQSQTGNRRFWPLKLLAPIDAEMLKRDRQQLWGEAAKYEAAGESIVLDKELWPKVGEEQEKRRVKDPWEDVLNDIPTHAVEGMYGKVEFIFLKEGNDEAPGAMQIRYLSKGKSREEVASADLLKFVLGVQVQHQTNAHNMRLATVMKRLGWERRRVRINDQQVRGYSRPISAAAAKDFNWVPYAEVQARRAQERGKWQWE